MKPIFIISLIAAAATVSCKKTGPEAERVRQLEAELQQLKANQSQKLTKEQQLEAEVKKLRQQQNQKPSLDDILSAAREIAKETIAMSGTAERGRIENMQKFPIIEVVDATIKGVSPDENSGCLVLADVKARFLDAFADSIWIRPSGFFAWIPKSTEGADKVYQEDGTWRKIDPAWKSSLGKEINFTDLRLHFRRFDTGWRYEGADL